MSCGVDAVGVRGDPNAELVDLTWDRAVSGGLEPSGGPEMKADAVGVRGRS